MYICIYVYLYIGMYMRRGTNNNKNITPENKTPRQVIGTAALTECGHMYIYIYIYMWIGIYAQSNKKKKKKTPAPGAQG